MKRTVEPPEEKTLLDQVNMHANQIINAFNKYEYEVPDKNHKIDDIRNLARDIIAKLGELRT